MAVLRLLLVAAICALGIADDSPPLPAIAFQDESSIESIDKETRKS
ncbi:unnamed protein product [Heligmosomoides polygyrus]|uniref:RxLR effector protein n=1 Tax=Heligmosomoides polygyrus TaxID=6339 RepID=A0A183GN09_HELPZ|nr:unnamed protein product [Heligmosomoides polygyrus]